MTKDIQLADNAVITYEDACKRLKEFETLALHRKPLDVEFLTGVDAERGGRYFLVPFLFTATLPAVGAGMAWGLQEPLFYLSGLSLLSWLPLIGLGYDGKPEKKTMKLLYRLFLTKKQKVIQNKQFETMEEYRLRDKVFKLFVEQKKQELINDGVLDVLTQGSPDSYPQIMMDGSVRQLTPHQWRELQSSNNAEDGGKFLEDKLNMEENLRYLLKENPKALTALDG